MAWMTSAQLEKRQSVGNCYYCLWEDGVYVRATVANGNRWCCEAHAQKGNEVTYFHIYADTPDGRLPFTYIVFGPYANGTEWDVEVHRDHVTDGRSATYLFTQSDLSRDTHIVGDMIDPMRQWIDTYYYSGV